MNKRISFLAASTLMLALALPAGALTSVTSTSISDLYAQLHALQAQILSLRAQFAAQLGTSVQTERNENLIPPGISKNLERGKKLPKGILKKIENRLERDQKREEEREKHKKSDTTTPSIIRVGVTDVASSSARISWTTNERSTGKIWLGSTSPVATSSVVAAASEELTFFHSLTLTGLEPGSTYFYVVGGADASGNLGVSLTDSFVTLSSDVSAPNLFGVTALQVTKDRARIIWATDERADSKVWASTTSPVLTTEPSFKSSTVLSFSHDLQLTGLTSSTTYYYVIGSTDASGNLRISGEFTFTTSAQ